MTLLQLAFLEESDPNLPWEKFPLGQQSVQNTKQIQKLIPCGKFGLSYLGTATARAAVTQSYKCMALGLFVVP